MMVEPTESVDPLCPTAPARVPGDHSNLIQLQFTPINVAVIPRCLRQDQVVLLRNVGPDQADTVLHDVAEQLGLLESLRLQVAYAPLLGHRERVGNYRMTVNKRLDYQFIPPHCEGDSFVNMQLSAFYCFQNNTDGGETILMKVDDTSKAWNTLRENATRIARSSRSFTAGELKHARVRYRLHSEVHVLPDDLVLRERPSDIPGLTLVDVLTPARKTHSSILGQDLFAYWASVAVRDRHALPFFVSLLRQANLLHEPSGGLDVRRMDNVFAERLWASGIDYNSLFTCMITHKMLRGDLILHNNLTWAHGASNWTPGSGVRDVSAAFA
jgi:hypothetical protein